MEVTTLSETLSVLDTNTLDDTLSERLAKVEVNTLWQHIFPMWRLTAGEDTFGIIIKGRDQKNF